MPDSPSSYKQRLAQIEELLRSMDRGDPGARDSGEQDLRTADIGAYPTLSKDPRQRRDILTDTGDGLRLEKTPRITPGELAVGGGAAAMAGLGAAGAGVAASDIAAMERFRRLHALERAARIGDAATDSMAIGGSMLGPVGAVAAQALTPKDYEDQSPSERPEVDRDMSVSRRAPPKLEALYNALRTMQQRERPGAYDKGMTQLPERPAPPRERPMPTPEATAPERGRSLSPEALDALEENAEPVRRGYR